MLDQAILGEADEAEIAEYLTEYDKDWCIGSETEDDWSENILKGRKNLMSLSHSAYEVRSFFRAFKSQNS